MQAPHGYDVPFDQEKVSRVCADWEGFATSIVGGSGAELAKVRLSLKTSIIITYLYNIIYGFV